MISLKTELIQQAFTVNSLQFGSFTLKSGRFVISPSYLILSHTTLHYTRPSPYFFNAGLLSTGPIIATLASAYASTILAEFPASHIDVLFGPAYKGIPLAATTALVLHTSHNTPVGFAYDRKEVKDHGEGGQMVGVSLKGKRVLILDDVMTAGTAVRLSIERVQREGGTVVGVVQCLDREEVGQDGISSTVREIESIVGVGNVKSILKMRDLILWLEKQDGMEKQLHDMREYRDQYGITPR